MQDHHPAYFETLIPLCSLCVPPRPQSDAGLLLVSHVGSAAGNCVTRSVRFRLGSSEKGDSWVHESCVFLLNSKLVMLLKNKHSKKKSHEEPAESLLEAAAFRAVGGWLRAPPGG